MAKREDFFERAGRLTFIWYAMRISMAKSIAGGAKIATIWPMGTVVSMRVWVDWTPELALKLQGPLFSKISHVFHVLRGLGLAALFSCK